MKHWLFQKCNHHNFSTSYHKNTAENSQNTTKAYKSTETGTGKIKTSHTAKPEPKTNPVTWVRTAWTPYRWPCIQYGIANHSNKSHYGMPIWVEIVIL